MTELQHDIVATPVEGIRIWKFGRSKLWRTSKIIIPRTPTPKYVQALPEDRDPEPLLSAYAGYGGWDNEEPARCKMSLLAVPTQVRHEEKAPMVDCMCGYWALRPSKAGWKKLHSMRNPKTMYVYGTVLLWGKIIEGTEGWRAEYARPHQLFLQPDQAAFAGELHDTYGAEITVLSKPY